MSNDPTVAYESALREIRRALHLSDFEEHEAVLATIKRLITYGDQLKRRLNESLPLEPEAVSLKPGTWECTRCGQVHDGGQCEPPAVALVYVLSQGMSYDGSSPVVAFETQADAEATKAACEAHLKLKPDIDKRLDGPDWEAAIAEQDAWLAKSPLGEEASFTTDYFVVTPIELRRGLTKCDCGLVAPAPGAECEGCGRLA